MPLTNLAVAEEALSLSPADRADLAKLLIQCLENDHRSDAEIRSELNRRLDDLLPGRDAGLKFEQVFGARELKRPEGRAPQIFLVANPKQACRLQA
jgi:putative addiction module component (TIGR02574 family)